MAATAVDNMNLGGVAGITSLAKTEETKPRWAPPPSES
jgi:hypothetical protein